MSTSRKPRLNIEPASGGAAFEGAFARPTVPEPERPNVAEVDPGERPAGTAGATMPVRRPQAPAPGDADYDSIVQGNWNVPAWMRAKVRAAAEEAGVGQNEVIQEALRRHVEEIERKRGAGFTLEARHFGIRRGRK